VPKFILRFNFQCLLITGCVSIYVEHSYCIFGHAVQNRFNVLMFAGSRCPLF
jgi:hypothetical protein